MRTRRAATPSSTACSRCASPVVIGVRADLYGRLSDHADLARAVADNQILLGAMGDEELERADHRARTGGRACDSSRASWS